VSQLFVMPKGVKIEPYVGGRSVVGSMLGGQLDEMRVKDDKGQVFSVSKRGMSRDQAIINLPDGSRVVIKGKTYEKTQGVTDWVDTPRDFIDRLFNRQG